MSDDERTRAAKRAPEETIAARPRARAPEHAPSPRAELPIVSLHGPATLGAFGSDEAGAELAVTSVLGVGGMGRVLLGRQRSLKRDVAIKMVHDPSAMQDDLVREARIIGMLEHPNVVPVHLLARSEREGAPFLVMKRIEGVRWLDLIRASDHPHWARVPGSEDRLAAHLEIFGAVCNAVAVAHERGIVHRDIKPANVMVGRLGEVYLTDWGVALDRHGPLRDDAPFAGTPTYAAPEMVRGDEREIDERTDVFLLGATLHHALVGSPRHSTVSVEAALGGAAMVEPFAYGPDVPGELASLCNRATSARPEERPASALEMRDAVREWLRHRDSYALLARARAHVAAIEDAGDGVDRAMLEARIALDEAERLWARNPDVAALRVRALRAIVRVEVTREQPATARVALQELRELGATTSDEDALVRALEAKLAERRAIEHELDLDADAIARSRLLLAVGVLGAITATTAIVMRLSLDSASARWQVLVTPGVLAVGYAAIVAYFRRALLTNTANTRAVATLGGIFASSLFVRALGLAQDVALPAIFVFDLAALAILMASATLLAFRRLALFAGFAACAAIVGAIWPERAQHAYVATVLAALVHAYREWVRARRVTGAR
ncbi:serine/threonine-protein kinase [Sandaracinus amylolyticus]|uniref:Serine/threonine protein kinase n=1 Tax=Sandaracinus amylolyticus TaxID=927083 RepID=A0A0F6YK91_9BACT|nr:serine/threonine-protein kinase [Sandaracinus amylolyticus]AKF08076.1 serine/threonine protein kinase [Sandaracinus amylolyticus]